MSRIRVQNFGPIRDSGWVDIKKVTFFLGNQGSGKSTIAKLISTFLWMEKALFRGDVSSKWFQRKGRFRSSLLSYHRLENYFARNGNAICSIDYAGEYCNFHFDGQDLTVEENKRSNYVLPQITYIPAERNFISYVRTAKDLKQTSESFKTFIAEFDNAKQSIKENVRLPFPVTLEYDRLNDVVHLRGQNYRIKLSEAASGFQSFAPLYIVMHYLSAMVSQTGRSAEPDMTADERQRFHKNVAELYANPDLTDEQRRIALSALSQQFKKEALLSIIEEPEQNLFPSSQNKMLFSLMEFNNQRPANKLIVTTHSPYLVNALTLAIQGAELKRKIGEKRADLLGRLNAIVPINAVTPVSDIAVYQLDESKGTVTPLPMPRGIPSDANYLNESLGASNEAFGQLLDIEEELG